MTKAVDQYLAHKIAERKEQNAFRTFKINEKGVDFCSNDYLGLAKDFELYQQSHEDINRTSKALNGSTGARTITGTSKYILELEKQLADFHKAEAGLIFNSGYTANLGFFSALPYREDAVFYDELIHASIRDGLRMSRAKSFSFKHNDLVDLGKKLKRTNGVKYVVVEGVYSMDGDQSPLRELASLCEKNEAALIVDEAHSNGIYGKNGSGLVCELGLEKRVFARVMTFGKALGCHGAIVLGSKDLKDFLINFSRPFIYTTAPSPHQVFSIKNAYDKLSKVSDRVLKLNELVSFFKLKLQYYLKLDLIPSSSPIQGIIIAGNDRVKAVCSAVNEDGFDVRPIVAPTVPQGLERIRICLHCYNSKEEIEGLIKSIQKHLDNYDQA